MNVGSQTKAALVTHREEAQRILDRLPVVVFEYTLQPNGSRDFSYINPRCEEVLGYTQAELLSGVHPMASFVHPEDRSSFELVFNEVMTSKTPFQWEGRILGKHRTAWIEAVGVPRHDDEGNCIWNGVITDISHRKSLERARSENEVLFTQLFESSPLAVVMLDNKGKVVKVNKGFEALFGFSQPELRGNGLNDFIVPDNLEQEGNELNQLISGKQTIRLQTKRLRKDGAELSVILLGVPVILANETIGIFGVYVDITEQKKLEDELKTRNTELDNFVYKVSHDLRAPLSSILGLVNLAKLPGNQDNPVEYLSLVGDRVKKLDGFINDVLSHSKNLKMEIKLAPVDLKAIVDKHFQDLSYMPQAARVSYNINVEGDVFFSDPWRISEVFRNLISNAIKYLDPYKTQPQVDIQVKITRESARIQFRDNGVGIEEKDQGRVFEMFYRASDRSAGSGLGLYIVKNAVEKLGGEIKIKSIFGEGTAFTISLPNYPQP